MTFCDGLMRGGVRDCSSSAGSGQSHVDFAWEMTTMKCILWVGQNAKQRWDVRDTFSDFQLKGHFALQSEMQLQIILSSSKARQHNIVLEV